MDSRDSLSASASDVGRDGSASDEDSVLVVTSRLAKDAVLYFQSGKFSECIGVLNQLKQMKENDPKILHNIAIAEYFRDGCSVPTKLLEALNRVKKQSDELARATREQVDAANPGNKTVGTKESSTNGQSSSTSCNDEFDNTVTVFNIAITRFHLHDYGKALSILEHLFQNIEPLDETIALQICFLLLDVALACRDASKFAAVLNYMEKTYGVGCGSQVENGNSVQLSTNQVSKIASLQTSSLASDSANSDLAAGESTLSRSLSEETLEYDNGLAEIGEQSLTKQVDRFPANNVVKAIGDRSISAVDLKLELQLYKVRFFLLTRNLKLAKREVKHAMNIARSRDSSVNIDRGRDSSVALLLKSQLEYARGNHEKARKLVFASGETKTSIMYNNNIGCIDYQLGNYQTSTLSLSNAYRACLSPRKEKATKLLSLSQDKSMLVTYNCGLLYLASGKPGVAVRCFEKATCVFRKQPLLWLRIAECCLMDLKMRLLEKGRSEIKVQVYGKGKWRHLLIKEKERVEVTSPDQSKLSLINARAYLKKALRLLNKSSVNGSKSDHQVEPSSVRKESIEESSSDPTGMALGSGQANTNTSMKETKGGTNQDMIRNSLSLYEDVRARENHMMKQALLANTAFVELELEDYVKALPAAKSLLELPECSKIYVFLGHIYAAEALSLQNKAEEAAKHLSVYLHGQDSIELPFIQEDLNQWRFHRSVDCEERKDSSTGEAKDNTAFLSPEEARGSVYANLAAMRAIRGDFDRAQQLVSQALSILPNNVQATLTGIYIDLKLGKTQDAVARLKQCNRVSFLPAKLELNRNS
ncbi:PREDICTED: CCR4-NOT transcription complex subunit 10-like [Tarenaya hassleriana]|uniref:CCR4-NOT transcription complex subunit 10-like n=1 Tax=Tarenaya hassleriana TaxID=28532 RepID=UPI00053C75C7|nr:PREDICTED: CCR4-NOT transcription complex subunit 10-like [Tarenaya hassleriana]